MLESARSGDVESRPILVWAYLFRTAEIALRFVPEGMAELNAVQETNRVLMRLVTQAPEPSIAAIGA